MNERTQGLLQQLKEGVSRLSDSQQWQAFLDTQARFHSYSFNNTLLILLQRPDATRVAGYKAWQKLGRYVRKGEKGIAILAPLTYKRVDEDTGEEVRGVRGFRTVYVFDIAQTEGKELPAITQLLEGEEGQQLLFAMCDVADEIGVNVEFGETGRANGYYNPHSHSIRIGEHLPTNQQAKTLIHELAHSILHTKRSEEVSREQGEIEAESVAYVVAAHFGLDTSAYSFGYVAAWSGADPELILEYGARIQSAAAIIIDAAETVAARKQGSAA